MKNDLLCLYLCFREVLGRFRVILHSSEFKVDMVLNSFPMYPRVSFPTHRLSIYCGMILPMEDMEVSNN